MPTMTLNYPDGTFRDGTYRQGEDNAYLQTSGYYNEIGDFVIPSLPENTPTAYFLSEDGQSYFSLPFAPNSYTMDGLASVYEVVNRAGKRPLLLYSRENLLSVSMELFIAPKEQTYVIQSVEDWLTDFRRFARQKKRWTFAYDGQVAGTWWRFTEASISTDLRRPTDNRIAVARISVTLTEATDLEVSVGPVTGGIGATTPNPTGTPNRIHVLKSGDTWWALATRYLGDGKRYKEILELNGISNPMSGRVGQEIKIPNA